MTTRHFWLWVTRPETYAEEDGSDRRDLSPDEVSGGGWWTCHEDTRRGDLVLLYRTAPRKDIAYLFQSASDAFLLEEEAPEGTISAAELDDVVIEAIRSRSSAGLVIEALEAEQTKWLSRRRELISQFDQMSWQLSVDDASDEDSKQLEAKQADIGAALDVAEEQLDRIADGLALAFGDALEAAGVSRDVELFQPSGFHGQWVCEWESLFQFSSPLGLAEMRSDQLLADEFNALRADFNQRAYRVEPVIWDRLVSRLGESNPSFLDQLAETLSLPVAKGVLLEEEIEQRLVGNLDALDPLAQLQLYAGRDVTGREVIGRQLPCGGWGRIDLLCRDQEGLVVIELKRDRATAPALSQLLSYMGWVREHLAESDDVVRGIVVSREFDEKFKYGLAEQENVDHVQLETLAAPLGLSLN